MKGCGRRRTLWAATLLVAGLGVSCGAKASLGPTATVAQPPTTTDVWSAPGVIDVAYLQRVMNRLDQSLGEALRELVATRAVDAKVESIFQAIYGEPELSRTNTDYADIVSHRLALYQPVPGNPTTSVQKILSTTPRCTFFTATRSLGRALVRPPLEADTHAFLALEKADLPQPALQLNPTGVVLILDAFTRSGATPKDPCT